MDHDKTQRIYIPMRTRTERKLVMLEGMAIIRAALDEVPAGQRPAGFLLAAAIVDRELANARAEHAQNALRDAARAGVNVSDKNIIAGGEDGKLVLFAVPMDLAERAEEGQ